jgi:hypothetical protein
MFSQYEIESELSDAVPNGIKTEIARKTGIYPAIVDAYFNRDNERKSPQFQTLQMQAAMDELHPEIGERHWRTLERLREAGKPAKKGGLCVKTETGRAAKENSELTACVLTDAPLYDQLREAMEARDAQERCIQAILEAIHEEKESEGGGRARFGRAA